LAYTVVMTSDDGALAHELRDTVGRLVRRMRAEAGRLPVAQVTVLGRLDRGGPSSVSELAAAERMRPQSMAQTVHDLEAAELVSRRPDPDDRRRVLVEMTGAGAEALRALRTDREEWLTGVLGREFTDAEREQLRDALALLARLADA
jgi:DNA-binding MarR family transcriptional regulator